MTLPAAAPAIGVDLGGTKIEALLLGADGDEVWRRRVATPQGDYAGTLHAARALVDEARGVAGTMCTIGFGTPGSVMPDGRIKNSNSTCLNGRPIRDDLQALLGQPVRIANDADCLALSEATDGAGAGAQVVFAVILGTGCGAGIAVRGRLLAGPNGLAGEWGHNPLPWAVPGEDPVFDCWCGQKGCNETLLSGPGLALDHRRVTGDQMSAAAIADAAARGDAACTATLQRHASRLARALAAVINLLDPDVIVLAGGVSRIASIYDRVPSLWGRWVFSGGARDEVRTRLVPSVHGDSSGVRGAAWLWREATERR